MITLKIVGQNAILYIEDGQLSAKIAEKERRSKLSELVKKYSDKPSETLLAEIKSFFPEKTDKVKLKEPKVEPKEEINKVVETVEKPKPVTPAFTVGKRSGGEY